MLGGDTGRKFKFKKGCEHVVVVGEKNSFSDT